jgi:hypothetical protein
MKIRESDEGGRDVQLTRFAARWTTYCGAWPGIKTKNARCFVHFGHGKAAVSVCRETRCSKPCTKEKRGLAKLSPRPAFQSRR